jgi:hypothetical protein
LIQHYVIKFVSDLPQVSGFLRALNKTDGHDITEMLLNVALNTITLRPTPMIVGMSWSAMLLFECFYFGRNDLYCLIKKRLCIMYFPLP